MDEDRLSELPDSLILSILSLLDTREVVRTTILSKRWKNRWTTVPCLRFEYSKFVSGALSQWKGAKILEFTLFFSDDDPLIPSTDIDSWLHFAIEKQVEKLTFDFGENDGAYLVPQCLYSCSSFTKLILCCCSLKIERNVQWNQLKSLKFENLDGLSGDAMNHILRGAPLLEELVLRAFEFTENFNIRSTSLMVLEISDCNVEAEAELRIWAPNLSSLEISGLVCGSCLLYVPSLITATLSFKDVCAEFEEIEREDMAPLEMFHQVFRSIRHVQNVTLSDWSIQFLVDMKENDMPVEFPNADFLNLIFDSYRVTDILAVLGMFPKLKKLFVYQNDYMYESVESEMASLSPSLLHLETVEIYIYERNFSISPLVEYVLENADELEEMVLQPYRGRDDQDSFILDLKKLLGMRRSSPYAEVIVNEVIWK